MSAGDVTSSGAGADSPEEVVAGSIQLTRRGDLHGAFEQFWYPGYLHTIEFLNEELQITDLMIGQPVARPPVGPPSNWEQAVSVPVSWTHTATTGAFTAGPYAGEYVLVRHSDSDPWRIASSRMPPVHL